MKQPGLEDQLIEAYTRAAETYAQLLPRIESLRAKCESDQKEEAWSLIQSLLGAAVSQESLLSRLRDEWSRSGAKPGEELDRALQRAESIIRRVMEQVRLSGQALTMQSASLMQELLTHDLGQRMRSAYLKSMLEWEPHVRRQERVGEKGR